MGTKVTLTATNYVIWKPMMEDLLYLNDLHDPIIGDTVKPKNMSDEEWEKLNRKTVAYIRQHVDLSVFIHVCQETSAQSLWKKLETLYGTHTVRTKVRIMKKVGEFKFEEGISIEEQLNEFQELMNQLNWGTTVVKDELQAQLLFCSLPDPWKNLVRSHGLKDYEDLSLDVLKGTLLNCQVSDMQDEGGRLDNFNGRHQSKDENCREGEGKRKKRECY